MNAVKAVTAISLLAAVSAVVTGSGAEGYKGTWIVAGVVFLASFSALSIGAVIASMRAKRQEERKLPRRAD